MPGLRGDAATWRVVDDHGDTWKMVERRVYYRYMENSGGTWRIVEDRRSSIVFTILQDPSQSTTTLQNLPRTFMNLRESLHISTWRFVKVHGGTWSTVVDSGGS